MTAVALALIVVIGVIAYPGHGLTAETRAASDVVIGSGERVTEDLYIAAGTVEFNGQASRDVVIAAGEVTIGGTIAGSVQMAAGRAELTGRVDGTLRIVSGMVTVSGSVGGDVVMAGGQLDVTSSGRIGGNLIVAGGAIDVRGGVAGDVSGFTGQSTLGGTFQGAVDLRTDDLEVRDTARISGPVTYSSRQQADVSANAQLAQGIDQQGLDPWGEGENPVSRASGSLLRTLWALVVGVLLVVAAPRLANRLGANGRRLLPAFLLGLLALVAVPIVALILMVTVVGLPAGLILLGLYLIALYLTQVVVGMAIGRFMLPRGWNDGSRGFHLLAMTIGVVLIGALRLVPVPYLFTVVGALITIWGAGAVVMLLGTLNRQHPLESA